jgi:hypothetical protein
LIGVPGAVTMITAILGLILVTAPGTPINFAAREGWSNRSADSTIATSLQAHRRSPWQGAERASGSARHADHVRTGLLTGISSDHEQRVVDHAEEAQAGHHGDHGPVITVAGRRRSRRKPATTVITAGRRAPLLAARTTRR